MCGEVERDGGGGGIGWGLLDSKVGLCYTINL